MRSIDVTLMLLELLLYDLSRVSFISIQLSPYHRLHNSFNTMFTPTPHQFIIVVHPDHS